MLSPRPVPVGGVERPSAEIRRFLHARHRRAQHAVRSDPSFGVRRRAAVRGQGRSGGQGRRTAVISPGRTSPGRALVSQRKFTEAVTFFENAISLDPGQADYHVELGLTLSLNPRHREAAERHLLQAIDISATAVAAYVALGQMYLKRPDGMGRAGRMAREAMRWEPGHLEASELLAAAGGASDERDDIREGVFGSS